MFSAPAYHGPPSDHFDGHRFRNPESNVRGFFPFLRWIATRRRGKWRRWTDSRPGPAPPERVSDLRATFVNHSTVLVQAGGWNVLTDPVWSKRVSPVGWAGPRRRRPAGIRFEDLPPIDLVLVSHNHYDHLDIETLGRIARRDSPRFLVPLGNALFLRSRGIAARDLDWWDAVELGRGLRVTAVPVAHFAGRGLTDRNRTLWCGFVLSSSAGNVFFAGDTGYGRHFREIRERFAPIRLAILPIGAYRPEWFMGPVHLSPTQAVVAHADLGARTSLGIHFGTFELADEAEDEPAREIERLLALSPEPKPRFWVLEFGEGRDVPGVGDGRS